MNLADDITNRLHKLIGEIPSSQEEDFYKKLIIALAGSSLTKKGSPEDDAKLIISHADAIIKQLEVKQ